MRGLLVVRFTGTTLEVDWYAADSTCGPFTQETLEVDSMMKVLLVVRLHWSHAM